jgi:hypothetical protein
MSGAFGWRVAVIALMKLSDGVEPGTGTGTTPCRFSIVTCASLALGAADVAGGCAARFGRCGAFGNCGEVCAGTTAGAAWTSGDDVEGPSARPAGGVAAGGDPGVGAVVRGSGVGGVTCGALVVAGPATGGVVGRGGAFGGTGVAGGADLTVPSPAGGLGASKTPLGVLGLAVRSPPVVAEGVDGGAVAAAGGVVATGGVLGCGVMTAGDWVGALVAGDDVGGVFVGAALVGGVADGGLMVGLGAGGVVAGGAVLVVGVGGFAAVLVLASGGVVPTDVGEEIGGVPAGVAEPGLGRPVDGGVSGVLMVGLEAGGGVEPVGALVIVPLPVGGLGASKTPLDVLGLANLVLRSGFAEAPGAPGAAGGTAPTGGVGVPESALLMLRGPGGVLLVVGAAELTGPAPSDADLPPGGVLIGLTPPGTPPPLLPDGPPGVLPLMSPGLPIGTPTGPPPGTPMTGPEPPLTPPNWLTDGPPVPLGPVGVAPFVPLTPANCDTPGPAGVFGAPGTLGPVPPLTPPNWLTDGPPVPLGPVGVAPFAPLTPANCDTPGPPGPLVPVLGRLLGPPLMFGPWATAGPPAGFGPPGRLFGPPLSCWGGMTTGPAGGLGPGPMLFGPPTVFLALVVGSILANWSRLTWSFSTCVCWVAFNPDWTLPIAFDALSACSTDLPLELLSAGTANRPIGPSALPPSCRPRKPLEIAVSRDCRSPALLCRPCMEDSLMEKPELPVGPPGTPGGGGGGGVDEDGCPDVLGFGFGFALPPPRAMSESPRDY